MHRLLFLRRAAWRSRRLLRAVLLAAAVAVAVRLAAPPAEPLVPVAVAAHDLPAGHALAPEDVRVVRVPARGVPADVPDTVQSVLGQRAAIAVPRGLPLVPAVLISGRFGAEPPAGTVVVPVDLDGAAALRPGDTVELVSGAECPTSPEPWAVTALVLGPAVGPSEGSAAAGTALGLGLSGTTAVSGETDSGMTLIAVPPESGRKIAGTAPGCRFGAAIVP